MEGTVVSKSTSEISTINQSFGWMFIGLLITAIVSLIVSSSPGIISAIYSSSIIFFLLILLELGLVFYLSLKIRTMSSQAALASYLLYSALNGITLSAILLIYTSSSIFSAFTVAALLFGAMSIYGTTTKRDLTSIGSLAFMGLIGVIIASIVNFFIKSSGLDQILSYLIVFIFIGLTAYDTQKLKQLPGFAGGNTGIMGALMLYLDFINIFLALLRIMGRRRN